MPFHIAPEQWYDGLRGITMPVGVRQVQIDAPHGLDGARRILETDD